MKFSYRAAQVLRNLGQRMEQSGPRTVAIHHQDSKRSRSSTGGLTLLRGILLAARRLREPRVLTLGVR
jgi:Holliday junction resolvasome RuvABC endonuclease subunit